MFLVPSKKVWAVAALSFTAQIFLCSLAGAQAPASAAPAAVVSKIDQKRFSELIKPRGKPLLINFWATWCEPCRDEFPELVKIDAEYKGKIDFITISLDFEEDIATGVPKFLASMKAPMPTYVLITPDETAAISMVSKDWSGGLPMTVLFKPDGGTAYFRQGIVRYAILQKEIDKVLAPAPPTAGLEQIVYSPLPARTRTAEDGVNDARRDIEGGKPSVFVYGLMPSGVMYQAESLQQRYNFGIRGSGCFVPDEGEAYARSYNRTVINALAKRHGNKLRSLLSFANQ